MQPNGSNPFKEIKIYDIYEEYVHGFNIVSINKVGSLPCGSSETFYIKFKVFPDDSSILQFHPIEKYIFERVSEIVGISILRITDVEKNLKERNQDLHEIIFRLADIDFSDSSNIVGKKANLRNEKFKENMEDKVKNGLHFNIFTIEKIIFKVKVFEFGEHSRRSANSTQPDMDSDEFDYSYE